MNGIDANAFVETVQRVGMVVAIVACCGLAIAWARSTELFH